MYLVVTNLRAASANYQPNIYPTLHPLFFNLFISINIIKISYSHIFPHVYAQFVYMLTIQPEIYLILAFLFIRSFIYLVFCFQLTANTSGCHSSAEYREQLMTLIRTRRSDFSIELCTFNGGYGHYSLVLFCLSRL